MSAGAHELDLARFIAAWNEVQELQTPAHHFAMARWLEAAWTGGRRRLLLQAFRSSGKSTVVGLFSAWLLRRWPELRLLVLAADHALSRKMVRQVKRMIERHPMTEGMRPKEADEWASSQFTVMRPLELRDPSMLARGISANVTGSRADIVICDDVEVPKTCDTATKREELRERLGEIDYVLVPGGLRLFVGTPHSYFSIYAAEPRREIKEERPFLHGFDRLTIPILDAEGRSAWPERFPPSEIEAMRIRSGPARFQSQMMLEPTALSEGRLDPSRLVPYDREPDYAEAGGAARLTLLGRPLVSAAAWWDPAFGAGDADGSVVAAVFSDAEGRRYLHRVEWIETADDDGEEGESEADRQCRRVAVFVERLRLPSIAVEVNGLGRFLPGLLRRHFGRRIGASVIEVTSRRPKDLRILEAFDALLASGRLFVHASVLDTSFVSEMREWRPGGRGRDDAIDAVAGALSLDPLRLPAIAPRPPSRDWRPGSGPRIAPAGFDPRRA